MKVNFNNLTAWFSRSVSARRQALWVKHGGQIVDIRDAQFLFSQDAESFDTKNLFQSEDYFIGCVTVFHAAFIDACLKNKSAHNTLASKYVLLPDSIPRVLHMVVIPKDKENEQSITAPSATAVTVPPPDSTTATKGSNLRDPLPEGSGADQRTDYDAHSRNRTATDSEMDQQAGTNIEPRRCQDRAEGRTGGGQELSEMQWMENATGGFQNLQISKIPHVRDLPQVAGPIVDFVIGRNGYGVQKNT